MEEKKMGLLQDIQVSLLDEKATIGPILLKLRYLADRLGSDPLEDWVRHETEGYPDGSDLPTYRHTSITYTGTFTNGYQTLNNVGVAPYLIKKHGGDSWVDYTISDALSVIEAMVNRKDSNGSFSIDTGNLKLMIDKKIYEGMTCIELEARIDEGAFVRILSAVRAKLLDFTLALERDVPVASLIAVGKSSEVKAKDSASVTQLTQNIFNAPVHQSNATHNSSTVNIQVVTGDVESLESALVAKGLEKADAAELAALAGAEEPAKDATFGSKARAWLAQRATKGADGLLRVGGKVLEDDIAQLFRQFYDKLF
ncbi:AbiTii domain-containing protein [Pseudooceanicola nitratireducens]|uniref:AbiTii domain-containing protein n=1 Tax=Pseudooceanicola nitratireducens TaxID=517719 RepID=UPI001C959290|nr:hypothetical protein [Pseudooceanicola nitratireducens]MBY6157250.1 hypothetical protein [Pseudooceanicola nitratireducens]